MHLEVYRQRPDVQAVVHAHPPTATGFAVAGIPLDRAVLAEVLTTLGSIPIAEYATPSTERAAGGGAQVHQGARRHAAGQPRRADGRRRSVRARTTRWRRSSTSPRSAWSRGCSARENLLVARRSGRGCRSCAAPTASRRRRRFAPIRQRGRDLSGRRGAGGEACQAGPGARRRRPPPGAGLAGAAERRLGDQADDAEIRLTYRELSALIEDAIRSLR